MLGFHRTSWPTRNLSNNQHQTFQRLVVYLPLWKIWLRQLGWWNSQYMEKYFKCSKPPIRFVGFAMNELRSSSITRWKIHILEYLRSPSAEKHASTYSCGIIHQHYASIPPNNTGAWGMECYLVGGFNLPLWKIMEFVNEKDDIPYMKWKIKVMFQSPPTSHHCSSFSWVNPPFWGHPIPNQWLEWDDW